ncbi:MAG: hypothetical protein LBF79_02485 [Dysgonamonadaceae bacterium]|nr:hypothetical protein [Dysgonamonadaceae bacterium]
MKEILGNVGDVLRDYANINADLADLNIVLILVGVDSANCEVDSALSEVDVVQIGAESVVFVVDWALLEVNLSGSDVHLSMVEVDLSGSDVHLELTEVDIFDFVADSFLISSGFLFTVLGHSHVFQKDDSVTVVLRSTILP